MAGPAQQGPGSRPRRKLSSCVIKRRQKHPFEQSPKYMFGCQGDQRFRWLEWLSFVRGPSAREERSDEKERNSSTNWEFYPTGRAEPKQTSATERNSGLGFLAAVRVMCSLKLVNINPRPRQQWRTVIKLSRVRGAYLSHKAFDYLW